MPFQDIEVYNTYIDQIPRKYDAADVVFIGY